VDLDTVALLAAGRTFAVERPMLFELMFARPFEAFDPSDAESTAGAAIYRRTVRAVARWLAQAGSSRSPKQAAGILVATHRGLVASEIAGILGRSSASRDRTYAAGVDVILAGLLHSGEQA
jgi:DNA-directed RNA polymerase specialized sigma24 family protein